MDSLSPYLFAELQARGTNQKDSVIALLAWASQTKDGHLNLTLPGLDFYNRNPSQGKRTWILGTNPEGPSQRLAMKEAKRLVESGVIPTKKSQ